MGIVHNVRLSRLEHQEKSPWKPEIMRETMEERGLNTLNLSLKS